MTEEKKDSGHRRRTGLIRRKRRMKGDRRGREDAAPASDEGKGPVEGPRKGPPKKG